MDTEELPKISISYKGIFDFKEIYGLIHAFLNEKEYAALDYKGAGPSDLYETEYIEMGDSPRDYLIKWKSKKASSDDYFLSHIDVTFRGTALSKTEIMVDGKKESMDKGDITVDIKSSLDIDVNKINESHWLIKHFKGTFKEIMSNMKKREKDSLENDVKDLHNFIKRYFQMKGEKVLAEVSPVKKG